MGVRRLSVADVLALHESMMHDTGYRPAPPRDPGLLESAVLRSRMAAYYENADLVRQAALLAVGIAQDQPFLDGNERTAYITAVVLLRRNGLPFTGDPPQLAQQIAAPATRTDSLEAATTRFEGWLRGRTGPVA